MRMIWTRERLARRIDRCYLVAAWTRAADKRRHYLDLARQYRALLAAASGSGWRPQVA
jgi:hypothetical protein